MKMYKFSESLKTARKHVGIADHMLTQTYPLIKDPKLFLVVIENTMQAFTHAMTAILEYERYHKRIPPFQDTFDSKLNMLRLRVAKKASIDLELIATMVDIHALQKKRKESHTEFGKKGAFILCSDDYTLKKITPEMLTDHIRKAKKFIGAADELCKRKVQS